MRYYNVMDIKLQDIYIFITVSEFLSVTKTADYLYLSPSKISKSIKKLEDLWGVILFIRDKNKLTLTPAGRHAYQGLDKVIRRIETVLDETVQEQRVKPLLRFGCHCMIPAGEMIVPLFDAFREKSPNITFSVECRDNLAVLRKMLLADELDVIYTSDANMMPRPDNIAWLNLKKQPVYIIANRKNQLAKRDDVTLDDIRSEQLVLTSPATDYHSDFAVSICEAHGFKPNIYRYAPNIYSQLTEVYVHPHVTCIIPIKDLEIDEQKIRCWEIPDATLNMGFAYKKDAHKIVKDFIKCATECHAYF